jgi:diguanylate cyclase (GGDEF)-like protein/PAS domain S-box-containing protein
MPDMRTAMLGYLLTTALCLSVMVALWRDSRARIGGVGYWLADYALQFAGLSLLLLRGRLPDLVTATGSNLLILGGTALLLTGLERFAGLPPRRNPNWPLLALYAAVHPVFLLAYPSLAVRNILFSLALAFLCLQAVRILLHPSARTGGRRVAWIFAAFIAVSAARVALDVLKPPANDLYGVPSPDVFFILAYQLLYLGLSFGLMMMINRSLVADLEDGLAARGLAEAALRGSEEKFAKAFRSSPDAILISREADGGIVDVNDGFCALTGYSRDEALGAEALGLSFWVDPADRRTLLEQLGIAGRVRDLEFPMRMRSGRIRVGLFAAERIEIAGLPCLLTVVRDVTEQRAMESVVRLRLRLWEYAADHNPTEIMRKALDELEDLTGSRIGFYHLVEADEATIALQAWSTRTERDYCRAEGAGRHYPIAEAGVWVDCVRERRPVIHNDYAAHAGKRGLPDGHAPLVRELTVPTLRAGRVVAILGLGNKPTEYDASDVGLVDYVADVVWTIVDQRRTNDRVRDLNARLEQLALTDELTALPNRRAFFRSGEQETKKARRYAAPLSLLMLDVDRFKLINDTYGHSGGDKVLRRVADLIRRTVREVDTGGRLGGEEFALLLPNTALDEALILAERLRAAVAAEAGAAIALGVAVTVSIGAAQLVPGDAFDALLSKADAAMYRAKQAGRDRVAV